MCSGSCSNTCLRTLSGKRATVICRRYNNTFIPLALTWNADRQRALLDAGRAGLFGGPAGGTLLTGRFHALRPVRASGTRFAFPFDAQVHAVRTLVPAFLQEQRRSKTTGSWPGRALC